MLVDLFLPRADLKTVVVSAVVLWVIRGIIARRKSNPRGLPLPPGPKGWPLIGNLLQLPLKEPWIAYDLLTKEYGDIVYLEALGQPLLLLGSLERAVDVLEKRSAIYSDRPVLPALELMDVGWGMNLMQYGPDWRAHRRTFHQLLNGNVVPRFQPIFDEQISIYLGRLNERPEQFLEHTAELFGLIILRVTYGSYGQEYDKQLLGDGKQLLEAFSEATMPGRFLVNHIPALKYVPEWFPGAGFRRRFKALAEMSHRTHVDSFQKAQDEIQKGHRGVPPSMAVTLVDKMPAIDDPGYQEYVRIARNVVGVAYAGGTDTTNSALFALFLALAMHPEVQVKAQQEIDNVIGNDRLPKMQDKDSLPYVSAIVKELTRWHTVVPLGAMHVTSQDDEYNGYFIPKGTYVMTNAWAIMHDPNVYKDPLEFNPDRYLKDGQLDPSILDPAEAAFGHGRRICPGKAFSDNTVFLVASSLLAVFTISPAKDEAGNPIPLKLELPAHTITTPAPFKCDVRLRSPEHAKLF